jgi:hypothetical protein
MSEEEIDVPDDENSDIDYSCSSRSTQTWFNHYWNIQEKILQKIPDKWLIAGTSVYVIIWLFKQHLLKKMEGIWTTFHCPLQRLVVTED